MKMKRFKLKTGKNQVYDLEKETYLRLTKSDERYKEVKKNTSTRYFAVCPACDNPIQIIGLYSKNENSPSVYGKHYSKSIQIAEYNHQAYYFCPYASHKYSITKDSRKPEITGFEKNIYNTLRDNFDIAIKIIEQDTGLLFSCRAARQILWEFMAAEGYMYYWATLYNIPWILLYINSAIPCYGLNVKEGSQLHKMLSSRKEVLLSDSSINGYKTVRNAPGKYLDINYSVVSHKRKIVNDEVVEIMGLEIYNHVDGIPKTIASTELQINEYRFPNWISSEKAAQYRGNRRNQTLLEIAKELMPDLD